MKLTYAKLDPSLPDLKYAKEGDAGFDLCACEDTEVDYGLPRLVPTGYRFKIPPGYELQIRPRSSVGGKGYLIPNSPGTVDEGYRGWVSVLLWCIKPNHHNDYGIINKGTRIAQAVLAPVTRAELQQGEVATDTERGTSGFGSTGK